MGVPHIKYKYKACSDSHVYAGFGEFKKMKRKPDMNTSLHKVIQIDQLRHV